MINNCSTSPQGLKIWSMRCISHWPVETGGAWFAGLHAIRPGIWKPEGSLGRRGTMDLGQANVISNRSPQLAATFGWQSHGWYHALSWWQVCHHFICHWNWALQTNPGACSCIPGRVEVPDIARHLWRSSKRRSGKNISYMLRWWFEVRRCQMSRADIFHPKGKRKAVDPTTPRPESSKRRSKPPEPVVKVENSREVREPHVKFPLRYVTFRWQSHAWGRQGDSSGGFRLFSFIDQRTLGGFAHLRHDLFEGKTLMRLWPTHLNTQKKNKTHFNQMFYHCKYTTRTHHCYEVLWVTPSNLPTEMDLFVSKNYGFLGPGPP